MEDAGERTAGRGERRKRLTIGLYNSYNPTKFMEAHRRAMCRAGALAQGFDCNLVFFGFPFPPEVRTPVQVTEWATADTSIGEDGGNFLEVARAGRVSIFDYPGKGFPPQFGKVIGTTCRPDGKRSRGWEEVASMLRDESLLVLFGLGPKGLPREVKEECPVQLDITGKCSSLETCTAMGAVVAVLSLEAGRAASRDADPAGGRGRRMDRGSRQTDKQNDWQDAGWNKPSA
jgi:uncharacterized protein